MQNKVSSHYDSIPRMNTIPDIQDKTVPKAKAEQALLQTLFTDLIQRNEEMLDIQYFKDLIIVPTLKSIDLYSESAVNLLLGTAVQESRLIYLKQNGGGPALGLFQIEPETFNDIYYRYLKREDKKELMEKVQKFTTEQNIRDQVIGNIPFSVAIARIRYLMVPEPLPDFDDVHALARYWKSFYNTQNGSGKIHDFINNYKHYVSGIIGT